MVPRKYLIGFALVLLVLIIGLLIWWLMPRNILLSENSYQGVIFHRQNAADVLG
jgi:hypothetical protein